MENDPTIRRYRPGDGGQVRELHETTMRDTGAYVDTVSDTDLERVFETYVDGDGESSSALSTEASSRWADFVR